MSTVDAGAAAESVTLFDRAYWQVFSPSLHIDNSAFLSTQSPLALDAASLQAIQARVRTEGYFQLPPQPWGLPIEVLANTVRRLDAEGLPLPFAFVYDEFWLLFWRLHHVLEGLIGPGYLRLPDFWVWLVNPQRGDSGWHPHRDKDWGALFPDGSPRSFTIWLPLTDATPTTSCMYVVPANRDPTYGSEHDIQWEHKPHDIRALPAAAGSVLGWTQALLHWGSSASPFESGVRISVAMEFQAVNTAPFNQPLTLANESVPYAIRLQLIGKQILQYQHMYPLSDSVRLLAEDLVQGRAQPGKLGSPGV